MGTKEYLNKLEHYYLKIEMPKIRERIRQFKEELGDVGKCIRLSALYDQVFDIEDELIYRINLLVELYRKSNRETILFISRPISILKKKLSRLEASIEAIVMPPETEKDRITSEMIERAREFLMENLIEFKKGFASCPFHAEKTPSFHLNRNLNLAHCFGCGETADSIKLYQQLYGTNFVDTVRALQ